MRRLWETTPGRQGRLRIREEATPGCQSIGAVHPVADVPTPPVHQPVHPVAGVQEEAPLGRGYELDTGSHGERAR